MIRTNIKVIKPNGMDARNCAVFVQTATQFESSVWIEKGNNKVNAKSLMGIMSLALAKGDKINLIVDGKDEEKCNNLLEKIISAVI